MRPVPSGPHRPDPARLLWMRLYACTNRSAVKMAAIPQIVNNTVGAVASVAFESAGPKAASTILCLIMRSTSPPSPAAGSNNWSGSVLAMVLVCLPSLSLSPPSPSVQVTAAGSTDTPSVAKACAA